MEFNLTIWDAVATQIESLSGQPKLLVAFASMECATLFRDHVAMSKTASLGTSGRLKYAVKISVGKVSLVEYDGDGQWISIGKISYRVRCHVLADKGWTVSIAEAQYKTDEFGLDDLVSFKDILYKFARRTVSH